MLRDEEFIWAWSEMSAASAPKARGNYKPMFSKLMWSKYNVTNVWKVFLFVVHILKPTKLIMLRACAATEASRVPNTVSMLLYEEKVF